MKPIDEIPVDDERAARLRWALEMVRIGNIAVRKAQEENRRLGIPNWYEIDGMLISDQGDFELIKPTTAAEKHE